MLSFSNSLRLNRPNMTVKNCKGVAPICNCTSTWVASLEEDALNWRFNALHVDPLAT